MLFSALSTSLVGFAALAAAAPQLYSKAEQDLVARGAYVQPSERGLTWTPRRDYNGNNDNNGGNNRNNNNDNNRNDNNRNGNNRNNRDVVDITQLTTVQLTEEQRGREVQFTEVVEERLRIIDQTRQDKDNIRRNHYRNRNNRVNTVIVVVTEIIDNRDSNNRNSRHMVHQVHSNEDIEEQVVIVVTDRQTMTINDNSGRRNRRQAAATGAPVPAPSVVNYDPNANIVPSNNTIILPSGLPAPSWKNAGQDQDPAAIILDGTAAFVDFVN